MKPSFRKIILALFAFCSTAAISGYAQCDDAPKLLISGNKLFVDGRAEHIAGLLPKRDEQWFFHVTCHPSSRLFDFSLWTFDRFADRDGFYHATSWNLQVLDLEHNPEREVVFDRENSFFFWGDVKSSDTSASIEIDSVAGMPNGFRGSVQMPAVRLLNRTKPK